MAQAKRFRAVFFGTPQFAMASLRALLDGPDEVVGVVCQPDRRAGRGRHLQAPPVKVLAQERGVALAQPEKLRSGPFPEQLRGWAPDIGVVAAYGRILPNAMLATPRLGFVNVHASLLPRYRGAAPIQWAILRGETVTGVTIMQVNERMDAGDILLKRETPIAPEETYGELQDRLAEIGASALMEALALLADGKLYPTPQDESAATMAPMVEKEQGRIDWSRPAVEIARQVRAFNPWPSAFTYLRGKLLKIHRARAVAASSAAPGIVLALEPQLEIGCGEGALAVEELQLEGRRRLPAVEFSRSGLLSAGARLEDGAGGV